MATRAAPAPIIEYGEVLRKNSIWFACRATREIDTSGRKTITTFHPDALGITLMYFASERQLLAFFKGFHRKVIRVDSAELALARTKWLIDDAKRDEDLF